MRELNSSQLSRVGLSGCTPLEQAHYHHNRYTASGTSRSKLQDPKQGEENSEGVGMGLGILANSVPGNIITLK